MSGGMKRYWGKHTCGLSLFTRDSRASLVTLAGRLTDGASGAPSWSFTNWTTTLGTDSSETWMFSGSGIPWYTFCRLGGGSNTDIFYQKKNGPIAQVASVRVFWVDCHLLGEEKRGCRPGADRSATIMGYVNGIRFVDGPVDASLAFGLC